jgi:Tol biopolymer transport system component
MRARHRSASLLALTALVIGGLGVGPASAATGSLDVVMTGWADVSLSSDGTRAAFVSTADGQVYVRDLGTGVDTLVSTANGTTGATGFHRTRSPRISGNGLFVTFSTHATNLSPLDTDFNEDVYLKDLTTGTLTLVSTNGAGQKGNLPSYGPSPVSDDGRTVVFASRAGNFPPLTPLPPGCPQPEENSCLESEIYAKDMVDGTLTLLSLGSRGDYVDAESGGIFADVSADGTKVALGTMDALVAEDADVWGFPDIYVRDLTTGDAVLASNEGPAAFHSFYFPSLSADGGTVAFQGMLTGGDPVLDEVFVRDLAAPGPVRVSQTADGQAANALSHGPVLSGDGGFVAFVSAGSNLDPADTDSTYDVYLKDLTDGTLTLVSQTDAGVKGTQGSQAVQVVDGGSEVLFSSVLASFDPLASPYDFGLFRKQLTPPAPADANGDGVADTLQPSGTAAGAFLDPSTTPATSGSVVDTGGLAVTVTDAPDGDDGVLVTVGPAATGSPEATLSVCGMALRFSAGSSAVLTCGSVIVETLTGTVRVVLDGGFLVVTVPAGATAEVSDTASGAEVSGVLGTGVTVVVDGVSTALPAGGPAVSFASWSASGFRAPVDNPPVLNTVKSGRAVPLKWHLSDAAGAPVTDLATATVSVQNLACGLASTTDAIEQTFAGGSGLQNLGNGDYQLNWKTSSAWAGSCKTMRLDLGGGVVLQADFKFAR